MSYLPHFYGRKIFIPISIGTPLFSPRRIRSLLQTVCRLKPKDILCLICDDLYAMSLLALEELDYETAKRKAYSQGYRLYSLVNRIAKKETNINFKVFRWSVIAERNNFQELLSIMKKSLKNYNEFKAFVCRQVNIWKKRTKQKHSVDPEWEWAYLLNEVTMSLYITEIMGYHIEIYPNHDIPFIEWLYANSEELLKKILKKNYLQRQFFNSKILNEFGTLSPS